MPGTANSGGRNAKGRHVHVLEGTFRGDRHADETVTAPPGIPMPPKPLDGDAADEWERMVTRLSLTGALSAVDDAALYQYCHLFAETEELAVNKIETAASIDIIEENLAGIAKNEIVAAFQEITKLRQLEAGYSTKIRQGRMAIRSYLVEFGLTPSARARVKLPAKKAESKVDAFLNRKAQRA